MFDNLLYDDVTTIKHHEKRTPQSTFNFPTDNDDATNENPTSNVLQFLAEGSINPTSNVFESFLGRDIYFSKYQSPLGEGDNIVSGKYEKV